jgi:threonine/homoserine/homoserine lactone efflux protein
MTLIAFFSILAIHLMAAISPGPSFVMMVRTAAVDGFRPALFAALGLGAGAFCWAVAALLGLNLVFQLAPSVLLAFKLAGAAFLLWVGWQTIRHADAPLPEVVTAGVARRTAASAFRLGLLTQLANPKVAVFFGAIFVGMVPHDAPLWAMAAVLALIFVDEVLWYAFVGRLFSASPIRSAYSRVKRWVDRLFGALIGMFGIRIAMA